MREPAIIRRVPLILVLFMVLGAVPHSLPGGPTPVAAHESRPGYLEFRETSLGVFRVLWKKPARGEMILSIDPVFPVECSVVGIGSEDIRGGAYLARATLACEGGLAGKTVEIAGLESTLTDVLVRVYYANGLQETHLVQPNETSVVIGGSSSVLQRMGAYTRLGVQQKTYVVEPIQKELIERDRRYDESVRRFGNTVLVFGDQEPEGNGLIEEIARGGRDEAAAGVNLCQGVTLGYYELSQAFSHSVGHGVGHHSDVAGRVYPKKEERRLERGAWTACCSRPIVHPPPDDGWRSDVA